MVYLWPFHSQLEPFLALLLLGCEFWIVPHCVLFCQLQERLHAEKQTAVNRAEKKMTSQLEDLQKTLRLKDEDLKSTRGLLREQEEATRVLGEKMRLQTRTQVNRSNGSRQLASDVHGWHVEVFTLRAQGENP